MNSKIFNTLLFFISLLFIFSLTMWPFLSLEIGERRENYNLVPFKTIKEIFAKESMLKMIIKNGGNIVLFIPFGIALPLKFPRFRRAMLVISSGALLSTLIEYIQFQIPSRWTDVDDVILNTFGTMIGFSVFVLINKNSTQGSKFSR